MEPVNNIISISKATLTLLEEKRRIDGELAKREVLLMANLKLITMEPPKTIDEQNSPESPISGNSAELTNYETPLQIPLEREDVKNNSEDNINQETPEEQLPPSPEQLPLPQPNSIFDVEVSPLSVSHSSNNVNSAVEAPLSDDETLEVTDEVEREIDQVGNGERNLADAVLGGRKNNSFTVPLQEPPTNFTMKLDFSLKDLFATKQDNFHSTEQTINNFKWILKINYRKKEQFKGTTIPLSLGIFVQCKGPVNENNRGSCIVNELNFKIHNWNQGVPGLMKTRGCSTPFEPPFTSTTGVWFNLDGREKMIEEGLVTREDLRIRVSVVLIFRHPHNSNSAQSIPDD